MQDVLVPLALTKYAITNGRTLPVMAYRKKIKNRRYSHASGREYAAVYPRCQKQTKKPSPHAQNQITWDFPE